LLWAQKWQDRIFEYGNRHSIPLTLKCSHYGKQPVIDAVLTWEIRDAARKVVASGSKAGLNIPCGVLQVLTTDAYRPPEQGAPQQLTLSAKLSSGTLMLENEWIFWVFPAPVLESASIRVFSYDCDAYLNAMFKERYPFIRDYQGELEKSALLITGKVNQVLLDHLKQGGKALLTGKEQLRGERTEWGAGRSEYPRGTIIFDHPLLRGFPNQGWCDIPFAGMISNAAELDGLRNDLGMAVDLRDWPEQLQPVIMNIPSFKRENPAKLALLFEVAAGAGKLMVSTLDFGSPYAANPATRYFFDQLLRYLLSDRFQPPVGIRPELLSEKFGNKVEIYKESNDSKKPMEQQL
jgi:hypothetical protein